MHIRQYFSCKLVGREAFFFSLLSWNAILRPPFRGFFLIDFQFPFVQLESEFPNMVMLLDRNAGGGGGLVTSNIEFDLAFIQLEGIIHRERSTNEKNVLTIGQGSYF